MPHADSALIPKGLQTKAEFWQTAYSQLQGLLHDQRNWVRLPRCLHKSTTPEEHSLMQPFLSAGFQPQQLSITDIQCPW